jgi:formylglycine-generating enzyme required for sulfatase activity
VRAFNRGFWLGKYEVTQSEWKQGLGTEPWQDKEFTKEGDDFPATIVSWDDAMNFCRGLTEQERIAGRLPESWEYTLPTEAQWERACRARTETNFSFGDDDSKLVEYAWFHGTTWKDGEPYAHRVGQKKPNPWGLYDMHGNVGELTLDVLGTITSLPGGSVTNPIGGSADFGTTQTWMRGGSYADGGVNSRATTRRLATFARIGFRVVLVPTDAP